MLETQVGVYSLFSRSVAVDLAKSSVQIIITLACRQDTKSLEPAMHIKAMSDQSIIPVVSRRYKAQALDLQEKMRLFSKAWERT